MTMLGFNFTKINVEKKKPAAQNVSINSNLGIKDVSEVSFPLDEKKLAIKFEFNYVCKYEPDFASIIIEGNVIELQEKEFVKKLLADWKTNKTLPAELMTYVLNTALAKCNIEAIILSRDVGLPSPVPMPKIESKPKNAAEKPAVKETKKEEKKKK